jgi:hypothetical protein
MTIRPAESYFVSGIRALDEASVRVIAAAGEYYTAVQYSDRLGAAQSKIEIVKGLAQIPNYTSIAMDKATMALTLASRVIPISVTQTWSQFWQLTPVKNVLGTLGIICYSLEIIVNSIGLYRGNQVLSVLEENKVLTTKIAKLEKLNFNVLKTSLPLHLKEKIEKYGNDDIWGYFKEEIKQGRTSTAQKVVDEIETYLRKKRVVQVIAILSAVFALAASVAIIVACPPLAILILSALSIALTTALYILNSGWVENPNEGFNWRLIFPKFMRVGKLYTDLSPPPIEMKPMGILIEARKEAYTPQVFSELDEEWEVDFNTPIKIKEPTLLERLKNWFKSDTS